MKNFRVVIANFALLTIHQFCLAQYHFLAIGDALFDIGIQCDQTTSDTLHSHFNVQRGDSVVIDGDRFTNLLEKVQHLKQEGCAGGSMANTLVGLAQLGQQNTSLQTYFVGAVGSDSHGDSFVKDMQSLGVQTYIHRTGCGATGVVHSIISDNDRTMLTHIGVAKKVRADHVKQALTELAQSEGRKYVLLEAYAGFDEELTGLYDEVFAFAEKNNISTVFTLASCYVVGKFKKKFLEWLPKITILAGNEEEFHTLFDTKTTEVIQSKLIKNNVPLAVMTMKENGATIFRAQDVIYSPVDKKIDSLIDPTGAGDNWLSAFLYAYITGLPLDKCGAFANSHAAKILMHMGARCTKNDAERSLTELKLHFES